MTKQILLSLLNCSWQWMLLSGLIWFATNSLFRKSRRSNTTIHLLWLLSLLSLPILFGLNQFVPALSIGGATPELAQAEPVNIRGLAVPDTNLSEFSSASSDAQTGNQHLVGRNSFLDWVKTDQLLCVWAIGALAMLVRFMFGLYRIHQLRRSAVVADDSYQSICQRLGQQLNINRPVTVCFSDRVVSPISFGWLSPHILIPRALNLEQFELVAAHELAHVQRHDWLTNLFSHLVGVVFFFHPVYHFLNRELVRVRERICDDWVIQLTGARKTYAQCLLDLVRRENRTVPLTLSLNQPSQLESRIDSILKSNRRLDVQLKPRLQLIAATVLLTCLPILAMAQLIPLKTFQVSLFAQTPQKSEKGIDKTEKKQGMEKAKVGKMDGKQYKDESRITVKDPMLFKQSEENKIFSGPQHGEKLPSLMVTGIDGELDGQTYDITAKADGKPLVLFLQDTNDVGVKGLVNVFELLLQIDAFQKRHSTATGAEKSNQGFQIGVVFLSDNPDTLPEWAHDMLKEIPIEILTGISPDGREGAGSYGLNRNVAQTVLIAKDGKVLHNFAFTQPMLYTDPHLLGAIVQAIEVEPATLEKWLNETSAERYKEDDLDKKTIASKFAELQKAIRNGKIPRSEVAEHLKKLGITWEEGEQLLKKTNDDAQMMRRERQHENRRQVEVADPADFGTSEDKQIFSGPQPGEKLPPLLARGIRGGAKDITFDFIAKVDGRLHVLLLQDESGVGLRGLYDIAGVVDKISNRFDKDLHISVVFFSDDPVALKKITQYVPENVLAGISPDGREGPGNYGLNRNVAQTIIIAKDGKVLHNFAFTQPIVYADPHVLGAVGEAIGVKPKGLEKWLNAEPAEGERMQRRDTSEEARAFGRRLREMVEKGEITGEEARERYEKAFGRRLREMVEKGEITGEEARERYEKAFPRSRERRTED